MGIQRLRLRNPSMPAVHAVCWSCQPLVEAMKGGQWLPLRRIRPCCRCDIPGANYAAVPVGSVDIGCTRRHRRT